MLDSLSNGLNYTDIMNKFAAWLNFGVFSPVNMAFDQGIGTMNAIESFICGTEPIRCGGCDVNNNGNGSLMRILPLAFYIYKEYGTNPSSSIKLCR